MWDLPSGHRCGAVMNNIESFTGDYRWLSNFWPAVVEFEGMYYPTTEHAYQAAKTDKQMMRELIASKPTPGMAKKMGQHIVIRYGWEGMKLDVMLQITRSKYQIPVLREKLLATGDVEIIEGNSWRDRFWGVYNGIGQNHLGKIIMQVRGELK